MKIYYEGKFLGEVITNQSLTVEEALELINIDPQAEDIDTNLVTLEYE